MRMLMFIVGIFVIFPGVSNGELLNGKTFEFTRSTASTLNLSPGTSLTLTISPEGATGTVSCFSAYDGTLLLEGSINQTITTTQSKTIYKGNSINCKGTFQPNGLGPFSWALWYSGVSVISFNTNVTHADCSADVQSIDLGVLPPDTTRTVNLLVTTTGGMLLLTSTDMSDGIIKMEGKDDVTIHPGENISLNPAGGWTGITGNSTINVVTSATASGVYNSSATVTLRCN